MHQRPRPFRYELIEDCAHILTMVSTIFGISTLVFLIAYIYMSSIKSPNKINATSYLFAIWFLFLLKYTCSNIISIGALA